MMTIGIMQGRLTPPPPGRPQAFPHDWRQDYADAARLGFACVEWLVTSDSIPGNPVLTPLGRAEIDRVVQATGVPVMSINADCFVTAPLLRAATERRQQNGALLRQLVDAAAELRARLVLPVLEEGAMRTVEDQHLVLALMQDALTRAEDSGVPVAVECDAAGVALRRWLDESMCGMLGACYDIGNAAAMGADAPSDLRALGSRLLHVHAKDRRRDGVSVPLGHGDADFDAVCATLHELKYEGALILETPRGNDACADAAANLATLRAYVTRSGMAA